MKNGKRKYRDIFSLIESKMSPQAIRRSNEKADRLLFALRLAEFRRTIGVEQGRVKGFRQPEISKIESRNDIKLSTLLDYCKGLGADVKIIAKKNGKEFVLLGDKMKKAS